ncbi:hypothetical protein [Nonomuraea sp. NPDC050691]|uniref:hypothetical protein n=1 Tax=Nonomuraea sp. NPDC050691 TaxID=3155661 RepID=UPI0033FEE87F
MSIVEKIKDMFTAHGKHHQVPGQAGEEGRPAAQHGDPLEGRRDTGQGPGRDMSDEGGPAEGTEG